MRLDPAVSRRRGLWIGNAEIRAMPSARATGAGIQDFISVRFDWHVTQVLDHAYERHRRGALLRNDYRPSDSGARLRRVRGRFSQDRSQVLLRLVAQTIDPRPYLRA